MKALYKFTGDDARIAPCIFCQVHAPTENELTLFADFRRQTLRGFLTRCLGDDARIAPCFLYAVLILGRRFP